jgi:hypothetical protein
LLEAKALFACMQVYGFLAQAGLQAHTCNLNMTIINRLIDELKKKKKKKPAPKRTGLKKKNHFCHYSFDPGTRLEGKVHPRCLLGMKGQDSPFRQCCTPLEPI